MATTPATAFSGLYKSPIAGDDLCNTVWYLFFQSLLSVIAGTPATAGDIFFSTGNKSATASDDLNFNAAKQQLKILGNATDSTLLINPGTPTDVSISSLDLGMSIGSQFVGGNQIAEGPATAYFYYDDFSSTKPAAVMGVAWGETAGSAVTFTNFMELHVLETGPALFGSVSPGNPTVPQPLPTEAQVGTRAMLRL